MRKKWHLNSETDVAHLEHRVKDLEAQLRRSSGSSVSTGRNGLSVSSGDTSADMGFSNPFFPGLYHFDSGIAMPDERVPVNDSVRASSSSTLSDDVVETIDYSREGQVSGNDSPVSVYRGRHTGVEIVRNLRQFCNSFVGIPIDPMNSATKLADALDLACPLKTLSLNSRPNVYFPSATRVQRWIEIAFDEAFTLWPFIDRRRFDSQVKRLFEGKDLEQEIIEDDHLGLIHAVIALGQRSDPDLVGADDNHFEARG